jgi:hypothetical protein
VGILASLIISETEVEDLATVGALLLAAQETCDKGVEEGQTLAYRLAAHNQLGTSTMLSIYGAPALPWWEKSSE